MNKKSYFVLCVLMLIIFLSAGVVCANDGVNTTDDELSCTAGDVSGVDDALKVSENVEKLESNINDGLNDKEVLNNNSIDDVLSASDEMKNLKMITVFVM